MIDSARFTDEPQSHAAVRAIVRDSGLHAWIVEYATERQHLDPFDTRDVCAWLEARHPRDEPWQRNVVSRALGRLVDDGRLEYVATFPRVRKGRTTRSRHYRLGGVS